MAQDGGSLAGKPVQFVPISSEIELPFYSALFASKLEHDKLDDSARQVLGLYEPQAVDPEDSCKLQILGNALTSRQCVPCISECHASVVAVWCAH